MGTLGTAGCESRRDPPPGSLEMLMPAHRTCAPLHTISPLPEHRAEGGGVFLFRGRCEFMAWLGPVRASSVAREGSLRAHGRIVPMLLAILAAVDAMAALPLARSGLLRSLAPARACRPAACADAAMATTA
eukprot:49131-Prymnesium_polylepis.1